MRKYECQEFCEIWHPSAHPVNYDTKNSTISIRFSVHFVGCESGVEHGGKAHHLIGHLKLRQKENSRLNKYYQKK